MRWNDVVGQDRAVHLLRTALERGQVHHAYLLAGPAGAGKERLARVFAQAAECDAEEPAARPCGTCDSCAAIERNAYPDVVLIAPQAELIARGLVSRADVEGTPSSEIRVDEVRALARRLSFAPLRGRRKIAIVSPADALNERAQNTLLKTLEEPPPATTFVLVSANADALLPTIRSRCARVQLGPVPEAVLAAALERRGLAPADAAARAARAQGSFARALEDEGDVGAAVAAFEAALSAPDEREVLQLADGLDDRDHALRTARLFAAWIRDLLVVQQGFLPELRAHEARARVLAQALSPTGLLAQAALAAEVVEALENNGNGRLQIERLLLAAREVRRG